MVVGLSAAVLQGASLVTKDIDLWFKDLSNPEIAKIIRKLGGFYVQPIMEIQNPPRFVGEGFELLDIVMKMTGLGSFSQEYKKSKTVIVEGIKLKILPLNRIILSKKKAGRPKDKMALPALEAALAAITRKGRRNS